MGYAPVYLPGSVLALAGRDLPKIPAAQAALHYFLRLPLEVRVAVIADFVDGGGVARFRGAGAEPSPPDEEL